MPAAPSETASPASDPLERLRSLNIPVITPKPSSAPSADPGTSTMASASAASAASATSATSAAPGYTNLTSIDWLKENTRERNARRILNSATGIRGQLTRYTTATQPWIVLTATGISAGLLAAGIDVATHWLADIRSGYCATAFYLNRDFCCWGESSVAACPAWRPWGPPVAGWVVSVVLSAVYATITAILVLRLAPHARLSGIPELKAVASGFVLPGFLSGATLAAKTIGLPLTVAAGLWVGKEGPLVHIAACCANLSLWLTPKLRHTEATKRHLLTASAAAGIAVAFSAPIGGVLFALEQIAYFYVDRTMWHSFACAMIAVFVLQSMDAFRTGKAVLFAVSYAETWNAVEIVPFVLLGVAGGLFGAAFTRANAAVERFRRKRNSARGSAFSHQIAEVLLLAVASAACNAFNVFTRLEPSFLVTTLFQECRHAGPSATGTASFLPSTFAAYNVLCGGESSVASIVAQLVAAAVLAAVGAAITLGSAVPAGVLMPTMVVGAAIGRAVGSLMQAWQSAFPGALLFATCPAASGGSAESAESCITPGIYAVVGAAAALGGTTRMAASIVVIVFELTGALTYVLPIMTAVLTAKWVADAADGGAGVYEVWLKLRGYAVMAAERPEGGAAVPELEVKDVMTMAERIVAVELENGVTVAELRHLVAESKHDGFPVVASRESMTFVGWLPRQAVEKAVAKAEAQGVPDDSIVDFVGNYATAEPPIDEPSHSNSRKQRIDARELLETETLTVSPETELLVALTMFEKLGIRQVAVCLRGRLSGLLTRNDAWRLTAGGDVASVRGRSSGGGEESGTIGGEEDGDSTTALLRPAGFEPEDMT